MKAGTPSMTEGAWILIPASALVVAMFLMHEDRQLVEFFALHPRVAPTAAASLALAAAVLGGRYLKDARHASRRWRVVAIAAAVAIVASSLFVTWIAVANFAGAQRAVATQAARVSVHGPGAVEISGPIDRHLPFRLRRALPTGVACVVRINSLGGAGYAAQKISEDLRAASCHVVAFGRCASACVNIWARAPTRSAVAGTRFGLHAVQVEGPMPAVVRRAIENDMATSHQADLTSIGFPGRLADHLQSDGHRRVTWVDATRLRDEGVEMEIAPRSVAARAANAYEHLPSSGDPGSHPPIR